MQDIEHQIETERLLLRPWRTDDADRFLDALRRPEVMAWLSDDFDKPDVVTDRDVAIRRMEKARIRFERPPRGAWAIVPHETGVVAGNLTIADLPNTEAGEVEIGWWLHPDAIGRGYVTEAARAGLEHAFAGGLPEIWAVMYPDNEPSRRVAERVGMQPIEIAERWYPGLSRVFRMTREEWAGAPDGLPS